MNHTNRPAVATTVVSSSARTTSSNSGNLKDGSTDFPSMAKTTVIHFEVTAFTVSARSATGTAQFYIDTSYDGGTTWLPAWVGMDVTTSTASRVAVFRNGRADGVNDIQQQRVNSAANTTTSGIATLYPLTQDKRIRWEVGDDSSAGNGASVTFAVIAISDPD